MSLLLTALLLQCPAMTSSPEQKAVEVPIMAYFRYHQTGDPNGLKEGFHPEALLQMVKDGKRVVLTQAEWQKIAADKKAKNGDKKLPEVNCKIESLEIAGEAAVAKLIVEFPTYKYVDYVHLLKLNEGWKIVDKVFQKVENQ